MQASPADYKRWKRKSRGWIQHWKHKQNSQRRCENQKAPNPKCPGDRGHNEKTKPKVIGIEEGKEYQLKGTVNIFNKIIEENFPTLRMRWLWAYRTTNGLGQKRNSSRNITIKTPSVQNKERILKAVR